MREKVVNQDIAVKFISTGDQIADIFTKGLSSRFAYLRSKLWLCLPSACGARAANIQDPLLTMMVNLLTSPPHIMACP